MKYGIALAASAAFAAAAPLPAYSQETAPQPPEHAASATVAKSPTTRAADLVVEKDLPVPVVIASDRFADRSAFREFQMSPDGSRLAITVDNAGLNEVVIVDADSMQATGRFKLGKDQQADWVRWAGGDKLLLSVSFPGFIYGIPIRLNRLFVYNLSKGDYFALPVNSEVIWGGDLVHLSEDGSQALISVQDSLRNYPSVYRYALVPDAKPERVVKPQNGVWNWHADDDGVVRLGMGWLRKRLMVYYRSDEAAKFDLVGKLKEGDEKARFWSVVRIISGSDRGYVLEEGENGRVGVRLFDYAVGKPVETFYENPDWDVEELWLDEEGAPRAAIYTDDREQIVWFDKEDEALYNSLKSAVKLEQVRFVARAADSDRALVWAGGEADPGALFVFDPAKKNLATFANYRPGLDHRQLVKPQPVTYRTRDGLAIRSYLTLPRGREAKGLPLIIMPHGGPYGIRDTLTYNDEVQLLANRGYAVLQPNFRGSGGYGEAFYEAGNGEIGRRMQDDLDDAMDWAVGEGIADPARVCVVGGSYGGYAALWAVLRNPERYRCAASWAGVTDLRRILRYDRKFLKGAAGRAWREQVTGEEDFDLDSVSPAEHAARLSRPVLLAHGTADRNVPFDQYELFEKGSRGAPVPPTKLVIDDEGHSFSKKENEQKWYDALTEFLALHNPADPSGVPASAD